MIIDAFLLFTGGSGGIGNNDGRTDSPTTGAQTSSNILDLAGPGLPVSTTSPFAQPGRDIGIGDDPAMKLLVQVTTAFSGGTNMFAQFTTAPDNGSGSPGSFVVNATGPTVLEAQLNVVGCRILEIDWPRPAPTQVPPRFAQLSFTTSGTHTAGKILGTAVLDRHDQPLDANATLGGYIPGIVIAN